MLIGINPLSIVNGKPNLASLMSPNDFLKIKGMRCFLRMKSHHNIDYLELRFLDKNDPNYSLAVNPDKINLSNFLEHVRSSEAAIVADEFGYRIYDKEQGKLAAELEFEESQRAYKEGKLRIGTNSLTDLNSSLKIFVMEKA